MRIKKIILNTAMFVVLIFLPAVLFSQSVFKVFILKGGASCQRAADMKIVNLKVGDNLASKDKLMLKGEVFMVLNHTNGTSIEIKKAGNYKISDLEKKVKSKNIALIKRYSEFLSESLMKNNSSAGYKGGLKRGTFSNDFTFMMPKTTIVLKKENSFIWNKVDNAEKYKFVISDQNNNPLFEKEIKEPNIIVNLAKLNIPYGNCSYWYVEVNGEESNSSEKHCIYLETVEKDASIKAELKELMNQIGPKPNSIDCLVLGIFFEKNGLISDAYHYFRKAMDSAKDVDEFAEAFNAFLSRASKFSIN